MGTVFEAAPTGAIRRYSNVAVALHWITALVVLTQVVIGFAFAEFMEKGPERAYVFAWHKTLGALILVLTLFRLAYRLMNPPPPFPPELPSWRKTAALLSQYAFYFLLIILPVTGLVAVSGMSKGGTTDLVGGISIPVIPGIGKSASETSGDLHVVLVYATIALLVVHVAAAIFQQFIEHDPVAARMPPFRAENGETVVSGQG